MKIHVRGLRRAPYNNTNGSPSAKSTLTMITETKPMLLKGWRWAFQQPGQEVLTLLKT